MKRTFSTILLSSFLLLATPAARAIPFFDVSAPKSLFDFGLRLGVNTSNRTLDKGVFNKYSGNFWGTGFDAGIVANLNLRSFISLQPGFFFESRSSEYAYINSRDLLGGSDADLPAQCGHIRGYSFTIPVMVVVNLNVAPTVRWSIEAGPYFQLGLGTKSANKVFTGLSQDEYEELKPRSGDVGCKLGCGLTFARRFYIGIHYMAGGRSPWKPTLESVQDDSTSSGVAGEGGPSNVSGITAGTVVSGVTSVVKNSFGGHNKTWLFTLGFNL